MGLGRVTERRGEGALDGEDVGESGTLVRGLEGEYERDRSEMKPCLIIVETSLVAIVALCLVKGKMCMERR